MVDAVEDKKGDGTKLDIDFRRRSPLVGEQERVGTIEWKLEDGELKSFEVAVKRVDTVQPFIRSFGVRVAAAERVGDAEKIVDAQVTEEIKEGDFVGAQEDARIAMEKTETDYQRAVDLFRNMVEKLLDKHRDSIFQLNGNGFNPDAMDGFLNSRGIGHRLTPAMESGNAYLIAPAVEDDLKLFLKNYQESFANVSGGLSESYSETPSHPFSPKEQEYIPDGLGFTYFLKIPHVDGRTEVYPIYFLYGDVKGENDKFENNSKNINEVGDNEGLEQFAKAA